MAKIIGPKKIRSYGQRRRMRGQALNGDNARPKTVERECPGSRPDPSSSIVKKNSVPVGTGKLTYSNYDIFGWDLIFCEVRRTDKPQ